MLKRVCDFCGKRLVPDREKSTFEHRGQKFRFAVLKVNIQNGIRWKEADICDVCIKKISRTPLSRATR